MKIYHIVQPEVIVGLGDNTEFEAKEPPFLTIRKLHINLEDWLGDDLMECHPAYIVTEELKVALEKSNFSGFTFENMEVTKDEYFNDNHQLDKPLSKFYFTRINGQKDMNFVYINPVNSRLMLSEELFNWLKSNFSTNYLSQDNSKVDDFMKRFKESQSE